MQASLHSVRLKLVQTLLILHPNNFLSFLPLTLEFRTFDLRNIFQTWGQSVVGMSDQAAQEQGQAAQDVTMQDLSFFRFLMFPVFG